MCFRFTYVIELRRLLGLCLPPQVPLLCPPRHGHEFLHLLLLEVADADQILRDLREPLFVLMDHELGPVFLRARAVRWESRQKDTLAAAAEVR